MPFPDRLLNDGEDVAVEVHPHWKFLVAPVSALVAVLAGAIAAAVLGAPSAVLWVVVAALLLAIVWLLGRYARWKTIALVVTNLRLIDRRGLLAKSGREIPLDHLSDISYRQSIFDRMLGCGDLMLESAGRDSVEVFPDLPRPARLQNEIYRQLNFRNQRLAPASTGAGPSIPEQIAQLDHLRQQGILTQAEFDAKKAELLSRL
ncbi:MAG: PH domain-containing protein [Acidimicrobiaceae bacterium]|nr:PH domain-containing protein [Acidimicrobiaceae bacterium]